MRAAARNIVQDAFGGKYDRKSRTWGAIVKTPAGDFRRMVFRSRKTDGVTIVTAHLPDSGKYIHAPVTMEQLRGLGGAYNAFGYDAVIGMLRAIRRDLFLDEHVN